MRRQRPASCPESTRAPPDRQGRGREWSGGWRRRAGTRAVDSMIASRVRLFVEVIAWRMGYRHGLHRSEISVGLAGLAHDLAPGSGLQVVVAVHGDVDRE